MKVLVTGAGGFIGHHLVEYLSRRGFWVRGVDLKYPEWEMSSADEFIIGDLRCKETAIRACQWIDWVFALAADMGGAGYVFTGQHDQEIMQNNILVNANTLEAAKLWGAKKYFLASSACIYPQEIQLSTKVDLTEEDAYPANPDSPYGWEKLFTERLLLQHSDIMGVRIGRFHNIFGPLGKWEGGREKAPAAACRKVAMAKLSGNHKVEVWGDGQQTRSFCYISDCLEMIHRLMVSDCGSPLNLGSDERVTIDQLYHYAADAAGIDIELIHDISKPQGVRGRNADLALMRWTLRYKPQVTLARGIARTYEWIEQQVVKKYVVE